MIVTKKPQMIYWNLQQYNAGYVSDRELQQHMS